MRHPLVLAGAGVRLVPLEAEHAVPLVALVDAPLWAGMSSPTPTDAAAMADWIAAAHELPGRMAFAVLGDDGSVRGSTSFYDVDHRVRRCEIGYTFYGRPWWGGPTNPATKLALLEQAFDTWGMQRVALRADSRNARSLTAIARLGAQPEGVLRGHRLGADGSRGDTAYFSLLPDEWPAARAGLRARLGLPPA